MGWREDVQREERVRELRRQQSELERDAAFSRGLTFSTKRPLDPLPSFASGRTPSRPTSWAAGLVHRGVYRDPFSPEGWAEFVIVNSRGELRRRIGMPENDVDDRTLPRMNSWLDADDPLLKVMA